MATFLGIPTMRVTRLGRAMAALAVLLTTAGCGSLDVPNPNAPDAKRAIGDATALESFAGGTLRTWYNAYEGCEGNCVLATQAQTYSASWNNWNMNFYASIDADGTRNTRAFQNDPAAAGRTTMEVPWLGMYATISSAVDVLRQIRKQNAVIRNPEDTKRAETIAMLSLGLGLSYIALNYDKGYVIDENSDVAALTYANRKVMRDSAVSKLQQAAALATANAFTTPASWTNGITYTNVQIARVANTASALTLANWPRNGTENAAVDWARVLTFTAAGMTDFDFNFVGDGCVAFCPEILVWFNSFDTGRVHTRVAKLMDPVTQTDPWPLATNGNPPPNSADKRMGDGSFGPDDQSFVDGFGTIPKTAGAGTDFVWSEYAIFRPSRGSYHQSNIGHIRYDASGSQDPNGIYSGYGNAPAFARQQNDLLRAEALIRTGGNLATAAALINNTRVNRGGLAPASAGDGVNGLLTRLGYENEIELLGLGAGSYYWRRRTDGFLTGTPREMPVPARELGVKGEPLYTWGGATPNSPTPP